MFSSFFSFLNETSIFGAKPGVRNKKVGVCKDEEKDQKPMQPKPMIKSKAKKRVSFETKPLVYDEKSRDMKNGFGFGDGNEKAGFKVKILMTKEEATRLMSKCKDGGRLEFKDVARELMQVPINRVNLVSSRDHCLNDDIHRKEL